MIYKEIQMVTQFQIKIIWLFEILREFDYVKVLILDFLFWVFFIWGFHLNIIIII